ncbi:hypothetical protein HGM15179_003255 [Zosterops borbonicus]|uniref:Uncharacterized protein n=1 Tax=Zosterops borbonicus TaxID=364589 RepID=A0A8K1GRB8_9PASS|nr:hypothetical protein HGM15179_003255 [Zosterops borbonicus]
MRFNKAKSKVLHLDWDNPQYQYRLVDEGIESPDEKDLGMLVDPGRGLAMCTPCPESQSCPGLHPSVGSREREGILLLLLVLMRPHLEFCIQVWCLLHKKETDLLELCQKRVTKMIRRLGAPLL